MRSICYLACLVVLTAGASACTGLADKAKSAQGTTSEIGQKVDSAVRRGIQSGSEGAGKVGKAIEGPVDRSAKRLGLPGGPVSPPTSDR